MKMSLTENTVSTPDAATNALWRAAETGNVDELVSVLPRVKDINARNEHGVTALMRAAQHGRLGVVRVLLERGADANIIRNDKFTALALAAFFGHTEVVRALMEHGADSQASTRHGTSPHMWATARTFNEVVGELENPAPPVERSATLVERLAPPVERAAPQVEKPAPLPNLVEPVSRAVARTAASSAVVRTLKDPPEIWDLVHSAPKEGFNARSAFLARLSSMRSAFAFRALTVVVLASLCAAVGVWLLRGVQARSEGRMERQPQPPGVVRAPSAAAPSVADANGVGAANPTAPSVVVPSAPASSNEATSAVTPANIDAALASDSSNDKPGFARRRSSRINAHRAEPPSKVAAKELSQPTAPAPTVKANPQTRNEPVTTNKNSTPLSPQLIAPVTSATPKAKVIQWP